MGATSACFQSLGTAPSFRDFREDASERISKLVGQLLENPGAQSIWSGGFVRFEFLQLQFYTISGDVDSAHGARLTLGWTAFERSFSGEN